MDLGGGKLEGFFFFNNTFYNEETKVQQREGSGLSRATDQNLSLLTPSQAFPYCGLPSGRQAEPGVWTQLGPNQGLTYTYF